MFIKTKDTIYEVVSENDKVYHVKAKGNPNNIYSKSKCQVDAKKGKTIEELCDQFVLLDHNKDFLLANNNFSTIKDIWENNRDMEIYIYGAIWTYKGLTYVAKMNEKGELELL